MPLDERTARAYEAHASELADRYESSDGGVARLLPLLFGKGMEVLDIGAGSGRDLAVLARLGCSVWGVEPSEALRREAVRRHPELEGRLVAGSLPADLGGLDGRLFDGVIMSALIMHVPDAELFDAAIAVRSVMKPDGRLVLSHSARRGDLVGKTGRDPLGTLFVMRTSGEIQLLFERIGFRLESRFDSADAEGRADFEWVTFVFRYAGSSPRPIDRIESIINRDRKTSTYKLALLRALAEIALTSPGLVRHEPADEVSVPLDLIALHWIDYYWPIVEAPERIRQNWNDRGDVRFRDELETMIGLWQPMNGRAGYIAAVRSGRLPAEHRSPQAGLLRQVRTAITTGPVRYAGDNEFRHHRGRLYLHDDLWRELTLMGHWIADSIILRWAELTAARNATDPRITIERVLPLLVTRADDERMAREAREIYQAATPIVCAWSGRTLSRFEVDHIIPYALRRDSSLWNLVPASRSVNSAKRDRLPALDLLRESRPRIIADWRLLADSMPDRFDADARRLTQVSLAADWERTLFGALEEAVETTVTLRGVERWAG